MPSSVRLRVLQAQLACRFSSSSSVREYSLGRSSPNPDYVLGQPSPPPFPVAASNFVTKHADEQSPAANYKTIINAVTPRPIAFISTKGVNGVCNLSFFNAVASDPPTLVFGCIARPHLTANSGMSDTHRNLVETGECVVHIISEWMVEAANQSCGSYAYDVDEIPISGLTTLPSTKVSPPRIAEAAVQMECKLQHCHPVVNADGAVTSTICIVEVVTFHINEAVYDEKEQTVDVERLAPMSRLGGDRFGMTSGTFDLPRPNKDGSPGKLRFR